jgi:hypothetical protein
LTNYWPVADTVSEDFGPVDLLMREHQAILDHLLQKGETSFANTLAGTIPKVLLLAAASWMEARIQQILKEYFHETAGHSAQVEEFIRINALARRYHQWFDWKERKPGKFFGMFGPSMKAYGAKICREDPHFFEQMTAFHELGDLRNQLVHQNYATFTFPKTAAEVRDLFLAADGFVDRLPEILRADLKDLDHEN